MRLKKNPKNILGLQFLARQISVVKIQKSQTVTAIEAICFEPIVTEAGPNDLRYWEAAGDALRILVNRWAWQRLKAVASLPAYLTRTQQFKVPKGMDQKSILAAIHQQLIQTMPKRDEDFSIDFNTFEKDDAYTEVYFAAAKKIDVDRLHDCLLATGLHAIAIDIETYALKRSLSLAFNDNESIYVAVLIIERNALLVFFDIANVLHHQYFGFTTREELNQQIKNKIQHFLALKSTHIVHKILLCVPTDCREYLNICLLEDFAVGVCQPIFFFSSTHET